MANITLKGNPIHTSGELPAVGSKAPGFTLVDKTLAERSLADFAGKKKVLTINPSYDTAVCQAAGRAFNAKAGDADAVVLLVSGDLPFAQKRFCEAEGLDHVVALSSFRASFGRGLTARAVVVLDENDVVVHAELVPEIAQEPSYDAALAALK